MYKLKLKHRLRIVLSQYKRHIIFAVVFLITAAIVASVLWTSGHNGIPELFNLNPITIAIGIGGLVTIIILVLLE